MVRIARHPLRWLLPAALCIACMVGSTQANMPVAGPDERVLDDVMPAQPAQLPRQAKAGSGLVGTLRPTALDAVNLAFELPDGRTLHARRQRTVDDQSRQLKVWVGTFEEQAGSLAVLGTYQGTTTGFISYGVELWEVLPAAAAAAGRLVLYRFDDSRLPTAEPTLTRKKPGKPLPVPSDFGTSGPPAEILEAGFVHDLLVAYTPAARRRYGQRVLESMLQNAVQAANQAYRYCGIAITLNLVGLQAGPYEEAPDMKTTLRHLEARGDQQLERIHALRHTLGADIVTLVSENDDSCGIAWSMHGESPKAAATAFNVVNAGCLSNQSLAHEVGHNQGNMHDRDSTTNTGAFAYSYGYRRCAPDDTGFRTVMAYACRGVARVARFSSPAQTYNGHPMGIAYEANPDESADNVRSMNNTADTVASFRTAPGSMTASAPRNLSAWTSAPGTVVLHWFDASRVETGFKVERSSNALDFTEIAMLGADATNYVDNDASSATRYYYRVRAYNGRGNSAFTEIREVAMW